MKKTIGLAVIARDEETTLPRLLASIEGAFDQVALLDTGSTDPTVEVFEEWSAAEKERQPGFVSTLGHFEWCDDFAAARNAADQLLETDWWCWADCDDVIIGAEGLRGLLGEGGVDEWNFLYDVGVDEVPHEFRHLRLWPRVRLRKAGVGRWFGRLHEACVTGKASRAAEGPRNIVWRHSKPTHLTARSHTRNLDILRTWVADEPRNLRPLGMLAVEEMLRFDRWENGYALIDRYMALRWPASLDEIGYWEKDTAEFAFRELQWAGRNLSGEDRLGTARLCIAVILGRRPGMVGAATTVCAEDLRNPEPAHRPDFQPDIGKPPKTRQQRRAEARERAKEELQRVAVTTPRPISNTAPGRA